LPVPDDLLHRAITLAAPCSRSSSWCWWSSSKQQLDSTTLDHTNPMVWIGAFVVRDLVHYWVHRFRLLWASHQVHHSTMTIGFTTANRMPWMEAVYKTWFGLWVPLIGINPVAFMIADVTVGVIGQLCHTRLVRRLPVVEWLFVTPAALGRVGLRACGSHPLTTSEPRRCGGFTSRCLRRRHSTI